MSFKRFVLQNVFACVAVVGTLYACVLPRPAAIAAGGAALAAAYGYYWSFQGDDGGDDDQNGRSSDSG